MGTRGGRQDAGWSRWSHQLELRSGGVGYEAWRPHPRIPEATAGAASLVSEPDLFRRGLPNLLDPLGSPGPYSRDLTTAMHEIWTQMIYLRIVRMSA